MSGVWRQLSGLLDFLDITNNKSMEVKWHQLPKCWAPLKGPWLKKDYGQTLLKRDVFHSVPSTSFDEAPASGCMSQSDSASAILSYLSCERPTTAGIAKSGGLGACLNKHAGWKLAA